MSNQNAVVKTPELSWSEFLRLLSPTGQQQIVDFIVEARETRGAGWLPEIKAEFPFASWIVSLACTMDAEDALTEVADLYPLLPVRWAAGEQIKALHGRLKFEIERKRI